MKPAESKFALTGASTTNLTSSKPVVDLNPKYPSDDEPGNNEAFNNPPAFVAVSCKTPFKYVSILILDNTSKPKRVASAETAKPASYPLWKTFLDFTETEPSTNNPTGSVNVAKFVQY